VIAAAGSAPGQVIEPTALAVDTTGNLYVADHYLDSATAGFLGRIQKRDAQGSWSVIATAGSDLGQVESQYYSGPFGLAVDGGGNLYVADAGNNRVLKYVPGP
jgi:hypothetical protein